MMTGCFDQTNVEDVSLTLILGIDLDRNNNLLVYMSSPVFNKEAKVKEETTGVKSVTVRKSRDQFDATVMALTSGSKTQVILVGKRIMKQKIGKITSIHFSETLKLQLPQGLLL